MFKRVFLLISLLLTLFAVGVGVPTSYAEGCVFLVPETESNDSMEEANELPVDAPFWMVGSVGEDPDIEDWFEITEFSKWEIIALAFCHEPKPNLVWSWYDSNGQLIATMGNKFDPGWVEGENLYLVFESSDQGSAGYTFRVLGD